ncbi:MAG: hypothetical protein QOD83_1772 [Solirubrobacteraceae bacterium]|jgi:hypothetical protein|nr:hypothetical protein [Solirubrobacteraceae bacterium]
MNKPLICALSGLALLAGTATTAAGADLRYIGIRGSAERPVAGATSINYQLRSFYIVPASWKAAKAKRDAITRRFGPVGSCKITITVTARAVADADEPAAARVTRLLPASRQYLHDEGTRRTAAWRVIRASGSRTITGMLVRPAPTVRTQPQGQRVWLELTAVGKVDPTVECHAGGPRSVAAAFGDMLAAGSLGGFQFQPR